jgi:broad specificity phosphatase PhoE
MSENLFVVSHQAVTRILYSYLSGKKPEECTDVEVPLHCIIEIILTPYGMKEIRHNFQEEIEKLNNKEN